MKYILLALISGLLFGVAWPTYGIAFFIFIAFVPLLMVEHDIVRFSDIKRKGWAVFGLSYLSFLVWNIVTTRWLYNALNPDGSYSLMAVLFPVLVNSLLMSLTFQSYHWFKRKRGTYWGLVFFISVWLCFEKIHLEWEFSWAWLNLGNVFATYPKLIQWYDTFGATGGSFWILLVNVFIFYALRIWEAGREKKLLLKNLTLIFGLILFPMGISLIKYHQFDEAPIGKVRVMMLQPNLNPYNEKYNKDSVQIVNELLHLADTSIQKVDYYLAPETAFPGSGGISEKGFHNSHLLELVNDFLTKNTNSNAVFLGGASTYKIYLDEKEATKTAARYEDSNIWVDHYNAAIQLIPNQKVEVYHKAKLVPGVEIFPYIGVLKPILGDAMLNFGGTQASLGIDEQRKVFQNPYNKAVVAPIICYESVYGEFVTEYVKKGANFLAIMTNDAWWGISEGHKQLLAYAQLRAIETRREIARAANTGVSAHINAKGEIESDTFYGDQTTLTADINLYDKQTIYTRTGDLISRIAIFVLGFLLCYHWSKRLMKRK